MKTIQLIVDLRLLWLPKVFLARSLVSVMSVLASPREGKSFSAPLEVLLSCYSLRLFCKKIDFVTNNHRREKNRTAKSFPSEQLPYIRFSAFSPDFFSY